MIFRTSLIGSALLACALIGSPAAFAQSITTSSTATGSASEAAPHGVFLTTPTPEIKVAPGNPVTFKLALINDTQLPERANLTLNGVPKGWTYSLKGGNYEVSSAMVAPGQTGDLSLTLTPDKAATKQDYKFDLNAKYADGSVDLPMSVTLADLPSTGTKLVPDLPGLRGTNKTTFKYKLKLTNGSSQDALFNLAAQVPDGFTSDFKQGYGNDEITGVPVKAGATQDITLEVKPSASADAGTYPIKVATIAGDQSASADLAMQITGTGDLSLTGPQDRLSGDAVAGQTQTFPFTLHSTGSTDAKNIKLSSSAPRDWKVTFDPSTLPDLAAGQNQTINVAITPSEKAIAGDYMVTVRAGADGVSTPAQFRVTVNTSTMWGMIGIGIIGLAVIVLALAVMRYGRR